MPPTYSDYKILSTDSDTIPKLLELGYIPHGSPVHDGGKWSERFSQAFVLPVEKPEVEKLIEKIQLTNNGYLFAPSESEVALAKKFPDVFQYSYGRSTQMFPHKISLK